jgi:hypothetical protein
MKKQTSIFDEWSKFVANILNSESDLAASMVKHGGELGDVREALINGVLLRILPSIYEIGKGEIVDCLGKHSRQIDLIIARRDFPSLSLPSGSKVYLIESILATIEVKSELNNETLSQALENCASVADLTPNVIGGVLEKLAKKHGLKKISPGNYRHSNPLETARFGLLGRPASYIFGFKGYKTSTEDLAYAISDWTKPRVAEGRLAMKHYPAVIATEGCFTWRNAPPYLIPENIICRVGRDAAPLRILILHLLFTLGCKIPCMPDIYGIVPNLDVYLQLMAPFTTDIAIGEAFNK